MKCKICGRDFSKLHVHVRKAHNMGMIEYNKKYVTKEDSDGLQELQETDIPETVEKAEEVEEVVITPTQQKVKIFDGVIVERDPNRPLSQFLEEMGIENEKELRRIIRAQRGEPGVDVIEQIRNNEESAEREAKELLKKNKDDANVIETTNLYVAEVLEKKYGYAVINVISATPKQKFPGANVMPDELVKPKTWVLQKIR